LHRPYRAAIVGTGFAGAQHVDALRRLGVEVTTLVGSSESRARAAASRLGVARGSASVDAILNDDSVDAVHVCVPNALHIGFVRAALDAGKHVICEKPLATSVADAVELARRAAASPLVTALCHNYRFYPMAAELRMRVASGALGRPHLVRGEYLQDWLLAPDSTSWRIDATEGGASRAVADIGTHWIDLAETVLGQRVDSVAAWIGTIHQRRPRPQHVASFERATTSEWVDVSTEDQAAILVRFADGTPGAVTVSQVAAGNRNALRLAVDGAAGSAEWHQEHPEELRIGRPDGTVEVVPRSPSAMSSGVASLTSLPAGHPEGWGEALRNLLAAAYARMRGERTAEEDLAAPLPSFSDGAHHVAFVEATLRSHTSGRWVSISDVMAEADPQAATEVST
jgi:predicted dehydrogenase